MSNQKQVLIVIDVQNDYFPGGKFPLWNTEVTLANIEKAIEKAKAGNVPVIHVQHVASKAAGIAPFFNEGTPGADIHPRVLTAAADAPIVVKHFADSFFQTALQSHLDQMGCRELLICGMMTQNCVTHTAVSKTADKYQVCILSDCCTTTNEILHLIALNALSTRVRLMGSEEMS